MKEWRPMPKQELALSIAPGSAFEILFGGARGGGKTDTGQAWLTYDAQNPQLRSLVIRRNADDLRDWIDRARGFYSGIGEILGQPPEVRFRWGSIARTGHLKDENAYTKYQGHEYQRILIEELTHIPSEDHYLKLIASCRSTIPGIEPQVMANCNPDGPGFSWVKKRWGLDGIPNEPIWNRDEKTGRMRVFIPSRVEDNLVLMQNDPEYINNLKGLPDGLREAWLYGSWSDPIIPGAYYTQSLMQMRNERRIGLVPYDPTMKVWTVWDLGIGGQLVCIFVQRTSTGVFIIDSWQGEGSDGIPQVKKMLDTKPYIYGGHFAPHDIKRTETGTGKTVLETAAALGIDFIRIPSIPVNDGIAKALLMIPRVYIDEDKCEYFIESLRQYRKMWDEKRLDWKDEPYHDWTSHYSDTFRYLALVEDMMTSYYSDVHVYIPEY